MILEDLTVFAWCRRTLKGWGMNDLTSAMVLYAMAAADLDYDDACGMCGLFKNTDKAVIHSWICYQLLAAGSEIEPELLFGYLKRRWSEEHENRVSAGQGS